MEECFLNTSKGDEPIKLLIIGNGFDLACGYNTSYHNYKKFIKSVYPSYFETINDAYTITLGHQHFINLWKDFEENISKINSDSYFPEESNNPYKEQINYYDHVEYLYKIIKLTFEEWILKKDATICEDKSFHMKESLNSLVLNASLILNFNYTKNVESHFKTNVQICHIHGLADSPNFGHKREDPANDPKHFSPDSICSNKFGHPDRALNEFQNLTEKDVQKCFNDHKGFFKKIEKSEVSEITFFGFSFSEVDKFYFSKMNLNTFCIINCYLYNNNCKNQQIARQFIYSIFDNGENFKIFFYSSVTQLVPVKLRYNHLK